jgi:uncharacterized small protein (DUF1192 family)
VIVRESMDDYLAREAVSSSMIWDVADECPAFAYRRSPFCPEERRIVRKATDRMDFGEIAHLAVLEPELLLDRVLVVSESDWRTKAAREMRDLAITEGRIALLLKDFERVQAVRREIEQDEDAAPLLFGKGESELTYLWEWDDLPCKARIDRLAIVEGERILIHLKTSMSAKPLAFANVGARLGYAMTCAWYLDGWHEQTEEFNDVVFDTYRVVVVASETPHLASVVRYDREDIYDGRSTYLEALAEIRHALDTGVWRKYGKEPGVQTISNPPWYRRHRADVEGINRE